MRGPALLQDLGELVARVFRQREKNLVYPLLPRDRS